jgi:hypothetical protein
MPSPNCQNVINLVVRLSIRRGPGVFVNAAMRELVLFTTKFLDVAKLTTLNSIIITNFVQTLIPDCRFEDIFPTYFCIEITQQNLHVIPRKRIKYMSWFLIKVVLYILALILTWGVHIHNNNIAPVTS